MIWRIRDRATFEALRRSPRRARQGPLAVSFVAGSDTAARVAFAVERGAGGAVLRNRVRRRLRAACRELDAHEGLAPGAYLIRAGAPVATMPFDTLRTALDQVIREAQR